MRGWSAVFLWFWLINLSWLIALFIDSEQLAIRRLIWEVFWLLDGHHTSIGWLCLIYLRAIDKIAIIHISPSLQASERRRMILIFCLYLIYMWNEFNFNLRLSLLELLKSRETTSKHITKSILHIKWVCYLFKVSFKWFIFFGISLF